MEVISFWNCCDIEEILSSSYIIDLFFLQQWWWHLHCTLNNFQTFSIHLSIIKLILKTLTSSFFSIDLLLTTFHVEYVCPFLLDLTFDCVDHNMAVKYHPVSLVLQYAILFFIFSLKHDLGFSLAISHNQQNSHCVHCVQYCVLMSFTLDTITEMN